MKKIDLNNWVWTEYRLPLIRDTFIVLILSIVAWFAIPLLFAMFVLLPSEAQAAFQRTQWGMSPQEVINAQKVPQNDRNLSNMGERRQLLAHSTTITGKDANVGYIFVDKQLVRVAVVFKQGFSGTNRNFDAFNETASKLRKIYGEPTDSPVLWSNTFLKEDPDRWETALSLGHVSMGNIWETEETEIMQFMGSENFEVQHVIEYSSKKLKHLEEAAIEAQDSRDL